MNNNDAQTTQKLISEMAVNKGYCTQKDVDHALKVQKKLTDSGQEPPMLGIILLEEGLIDNAQFLDLLMELNRVVHDTSE